MRICSCTLRVCSNKGPCDVQSAVDHANQHRRERGKPALTNQHVDVELAVGTFYIDHKKDMGAGRRPCRGCQPLVRSEVIRILKGEHCEGPTPRLLA